MPSAGNSVPTTDGFNPREAVAAAVCTLVVAWRVFETAPVCVAANRDESFDRPAAPPSVREGDPAVLAPRDERAGGTWLGYNEAGVLAAITNRWAAGDGVVTPQRRRHLRGIDVLAAGDDGVVEPALDVHPAGLVAVAAVAGPEAGAAERLGGAVRVEVARRHRGAADDEFARLAGVTARAGLVDHR